MLLQRGKTRNKDFNLHLEAYQSESHVIITAFSDMNFVVIVIAWSVFSPKNGTNQPAILAIVLMRFLLSEKFPILNKTFNWIFQGINEKNLSPFLLNYCSLQANVQKFCCSFLSKVGIVQIFYSKGLHITNIESRKSWFYINF